MTDSNEITALPCDTICPPRTIADFGGRRKIFERRLRQYPIEHPERRSGKDRRSGFDRRSTSENQPDSFTKKRRSDL